VIVEALTAWVQGDDCPYEEIFAPALHGRVGIIRFDCNRKMWKWVAKQKNRTHTFNGTNLWFKIEASEEERARQKISWSAYKFLKAQIEVPSRSAMVTANTNHGEVYLGATLVFKATNEGSPDFNAETLNKEFTERFWTEDQWRNAFQTHLQSVGS